MVEKEIYAHLLAYNLIRRLVALAAIRNGLDPRRLSFKACLQTALAFMPAIVAAKSNHEAKRIFGEMMELIALHRVKKRPNRTEPRAVKKRGQSFPNLSVKDRQRRRGLGVGV